MKKTYLQALLFISVFSLAGCVGIGGEKITLSHDTLAIPAQKYTDKLVVEKPATDLREEKDRIGRTTITAFAISSGSVTTTTPANQQIVEQIIDALSSIGYQVNKNNSSSDSTNAVKPLTLKVALNDIWFKNYNWVFPLVPTWGDIKITLSLENASGKKLFEKSYEGSGSSLCLSGNCAFGSATKEAMTDVLNKVVADFSSQTVRNSITLESH